MRLTRAGAVVCLALGGSGACAGAPTDLDAETGSSATTAGACGEGLAFGPALLDCAFDDADAQWLLIREDAEAWRVGEEGLEMQSLGGTLWEDNNNNFNVGLREAPLLAAEGAAQVHVAGPVANDGEQAGLLWHAGDDDYVKLVKEQVLGNRLVVMVEEIEGNPSVVGLERIDADAVSLRLEWVGGELVGLYELDGEGSFTEIGRTGQDLGGNSPKSPRLGLFTHGAENIENRWIRFTAFGVYPG